MSRMSKEVAMYLKSYNQMGPGIKSAGASLEGFRKNANKVFASIAKAGVAAMAAVATGATLIGAAFEQGMANTSSMFITAAKSAEQLAGWTDDLAKKARQLGAETAFTATETTQAMYSLASGGMAAGQVIEAVDGVLMLAGATMTDMNMAAETTMRTLKMFGLEADQTNRVVNLFAAGIQSSMLNMDRLSFAMRYAAPSASMLGMSVEETTASIALLVDRLGDGSSAGTGFRMMMTRLLKPTAELKKIMGGVTVKVDGLEAVLKKLEDAKVLDDPEFITRAFGAKALGAVSALLNAGSEGFAEMTRKLTGTNAAAEMYEHQMKTLNNQWKIFRSALEETGISIFDQIHDSLMAVVKDLQSLVGISRDSFVEISRDAVNAFDKLYDVSRDVLSNLIKIFGEIKPAVDASIETIVDFTSEMKIFAVAGIEFAKGAFTGLWDISKSTFELFGGSISVVKNLTGSIIAMGVALYGVATAAKVASVAVNVFKAVAGINPWIKALLLISAGLGLAVTKMGGMRAAWIKVSAEVEIAKVKVSAFFKEIWVKFRWVDFAFAAVFRGLWDNMTWLQDAWGWVANAAQVSVEWVIGALKKAGQWINNIKEFIVALGKTIGTVFTAVLDTVKDFASKAGAILKDLGSMIVAPWRANEIWESMKKTMDVGLDDAFGGIAESIAGYWDDANKNATAGIDQIDKDTAAKIAEIKARRAQELAGLIAPPGADGVPGFETGVVPVLEAPVIPKELLAAEDFFDMLMDTSHIEDGLKSISASGVQAMGIIQDAAGTAMRGVTNAISDAVFEGKNLLESLGDVAKNVFGFILTSFLRMGVSAVFPGLGEIGGFAQGGLVHGTAGVDKILAMVSNLEYVMPVAQTQKYLPELEAMRAGTYERNAPSLSMAGGRGGGSQLSLSVVFERGTLTILDNDLSVDRLATKIWDNAEKGIATLYDKD